LVGGVKDGKGNDTSFGFTLVARIPEHAVIPRTFTFGDFARKAELVLLIEQVVTFGSTPG
jgi:hypothetical protein